MVLQGMSDFLPGVIKEPVSLCLPLLYKCICREGVTALCVCADLSTDRPASVGCKLPLMCKTHTWPFLDFWKYCFIKRKENDRSYSFLKRSLASLNYIVFTEKLLRWSLLRHLIYCVAVIHNCFGSDVFLLQKLNIKNLWRKYAVRVFSSQNRYTVVLPLRSSKYLLKRGTNIFQTWSQCI